MELNVGDGSTQQYGESVSEMPGTVLEMSLNDGYIQPGQMSQPLQDRDLFNAACMNLTK